MSEPKPDGIRGDIARLVSERGTEQGKPSPGKALERVLTRPGPMAVAIYRVSHRVWLRGHETAAEVLWRINHFLTGADIPPGAESGGGLRATDTSGGGIGRGGKNR